MVYLQKVRKYQVEKWFHTYKYDKSGNLVETKKPEIRRGADKRDLEYEENIYDKNGRMIVTNLYTKNIYQKILSY